MTVFKGYMKILKKNIGLVIIYLVIFFSVAMALQAAASKEHLEDFEKREWILPLQIMIRVLFLML